MRWLSNAGCSSNEGRLQSQGDLPICRHRPLQSIVHTLQPKSAHTYSPSPTAASTKCSPKSQAQRSPVCSRWRAHAHSKTTHSAATGVMKSLKVQDLLFGPGVQRLRYFTVHMRWLWIDKEQPWQSGMNSRASTAEYARCAIRANGPGASTLRRCSHRWQPRRQGEALPPELKARAPRELRRLGRLLRHRRWPLVVAPRLQSWRQHSRSDAFGPLPSHTPPSRPTQLRPPPPPISP